MLENFPAPIYLQDVMPTTLDLAGVAKPDHVDFHSLMPLLRGETSASAYGSIYGLIWSSSDRSPWKATNSFSTLRPSATLPLEEDPLEMEDLSQRRRRERPRMRRLFSQLLAHFNNPWETHCR